MLEEPFRDGDSDARPSRQDTNRSSTAAAAGGAQAYPDGHGAEVRFPQGDVSFADAVEHYGTGERAPKKSASHPEAALGIPDNGGSDTGYVSLGCAGELVLNFDDNALVDVPGPDLYVFEIGPDVEPTGLAVSNDGENWTRVGRISGGKCDPPSVFCSEAARACFSLWHEFR